MLCSLFDFAEFRVDRRCRREFHACRLRGFYICGDLGIRFGLQGLSFRINNFLRIWHFLFGEFRFVGFC